MITESGTLLDFKFTLGMATGARFEIAANSVADNLRWHADAVGRLLRWGRSEAVLALESARIAKKREQSENLSFPNRRQVTTD